MIGKLNYNITPRHLTRRRSPRQVNSTDDREIILKSNNPMLIKRVESYFMENDLGHFDKTKPTLEITKEFGRVNLDKHPSELVNNLEKIFTSINEIMK